VLLLFPPKGFVMTTQVEFSDDRACNEFDRLFRELIDKGVSPIEAARRVWRQRPDLANAAIGSHAIKTRRSSFSARMPLY
jgi:hypothetical protein